ncbi:hypothetical protein Q8A67_011625 [Cirrhinus molitorella]|uniref:Uncharacterized protein n=1 Tax=Cirrhinus molitorella TaxID=172907 RepID=A0AA88TPU7_9TELE|nr:hypothetical protein Q8A67_011625 [Cirrhinus molitorella]
MKSTFETKIENVVRNMYEEVNPKDMTEAGRRRWRRKKLSKNPDVLFRIYRQGHLHMLQFRSAYYDGWVRCLKSYSEIIFQRLPFNDHAFSLCGPSDELERFCDNYQKSLQMIKSTPKVNSSLLGETVSTFVFSMKIGMAGEDLLTPKPKDI